MKMTNRELEIRYMQMKLTWKNLVNANVELVDENKMLKEENEILKYSIIEARKIIRRNENKVSIETLLNDIAEALVILEGVVNGENNLWDINKTILWVRL